MLLSRQADPPGTFIDRRQIDSGEIRIGRDAQKCDWMLPDQSGHISRAHCTISVIGLDLFVVDTSTNGVSLNRPGQRIAPQMPVAVRVSDRLLLGDYAIEITTEAAGLAANLQQQVATAAPPPPPAFSQPDSWFDNAGADPWGTGGANAEVHEFLGSAMHDFLAPPRASQAVAAADPWGGPLSDAFSRPMLAAAPSPAASDFAIPEDWAAPPANGSARAADPFAGMEAFAPTKADPFAGADPFAAPSPSHPADTRSSGAAFAPAPALSTDPFAMPSVPPPSVGRTPDPFARPVAGDPFADFDAKADPFAGFDAKADPFAGRSAAPGTSERAAGDPFAAFDAGSDPFAGEPNTPATPGRTASDRFGGLEATADPFAGIPTAPATPERAAADPFSGFGPEVEPFASRPDDAVVPNQPTNDPFALPPAGAPVETADPFGSTPPSAMAAAPVPTDPFLPSPAAPPAIPSAQTSAAAPDGEGWAAFCAGAGLDPADLRTTPDAMHRLGVLYKQVVLGLSDLIQDRAAFKNEFRVERTQLGLGRNNPLKHLPAIDSAKLLLGDPLPGFMGAEESVRSAFEDVKKHQLAMLAGVQHALRAVFERLSPDEIQRVMEKAAGEKKGLRIGRGVNPWTVYQAVFDALRKDATSNVNSIMSVAFREGYEAFLNGAA
ncbi:type VI secretion system-associated FHA domain protein TagH [Sphingomonas sp. Leaf343]|uniref:type VI secretion system-associated FHA domain protein TagH n=1 Tax=Sphingomonas sp. Leaf343 TaxID=1736345 RepID=UPI00144493C3|nr:type VI secretion system-associated FHA domain protein TagH [Sphingomonas sp. Leaf343]